MAALDYRALVIYDNGYNFRRDFRTLQNALDYIEHRKHVVAYLVVYKPTGVPVAYHGNDHIGDNQAFMSFFV